MTQISSLVFFISRSASTVTSPLLSTFCCFNLILQYLLQFIMRSSSFNFVSFLSKGVLCVLYFYSECMYFIKKFRKLWHPLIHRSIQQTCKSYHLKSLQESSERKRNWNLDCCHSKQWIKFLHLELCFGDERRFHQLGRSPLVNVHLGRELKLSRTPWWVRTETTRYWFGSLYGIPFEPPYLNTRDRVSVTGGPEGVQCDTKRSGHLWLRKIYQQVFQKK